MLVLKRKVNERVILTLTEPLPAGTVIEVLPTDMCRYWVKLGITAPKSVSVLREELATDLARE